MRRMMRRHFFQELVTLSHTSNTGNNEGAGCHSQSLPRLASKKNLSKSKAEHHKACMTQVFEVQVKRFTVK
jgi:hypothetical protein